MQKNFLFVLSLELGLIALFQLMRQTSKAKVNINNHVGYIDPNEFINVAPEVLTMSTKEYGETQDVFSFGMLTFRVLFDRNAYEALPEIYRLYEKGKA